jgi:Glycosyl transferases group 1
MLHILVEDSATPIYRRIVGALRAALEAQGARVELVRPMAGAGGAKELHSLLERRAQAVYLSTNDLNAIQQRVPGASEYFFERFAGRVVFLHQDSLLSSIKDEHELSQRLAAFTRVAARSAHLCIEADNVPLLHALGIARAQLVPHASELKAQAPLSEGLEHDVSFVGHVLPWSPVRLTSDAAVDERLKSLIERRRADFTLALGPHFAVAAAALPHADLLREVAHTLWQRSLVNAVSTLFRGAVIGAAELPGLTVFGGDPAYLHGQNATRTLAGAAVTHRPPVYDVSELARVYRGSAVSLNISSPQFDYAVPNRFHDVVMAGGLCLTDRRSGLADLTDLHEQVSYRTLDELRDKAAYLAHPANRGRRAQLVRALQHDVTQRSGYAALAAHVIAACAPAGAAPSPSRAAGGLASTVLAR